MKKKINERIFEITQILQREDLLKSIGVSLHNKGLTATRFYESMNESEAIVAGVAGFHSEFGVDVFNEINTKAMGINKSLSLEEIVKLVNELDGLMRGVNSIKLNLDRPLKKGDKLVAIDECEMEGDPDDKSLTIGKIYPVLNIDKRRNRICIIDDYSHEHYFMFDDIHNFFEINLEVKK